MTTDSPKATLSSNQASGHHDIAIIGGGIGGLGLALALGQKGIPVALFERHPQWSELGAGVQISANASHILYKWGLEPALRACCFQPQGLLLHHWRSGQSIGRFPFVDRVDAPYLHILRADLQQALLDQVMACSAISVYQGYELKQVSGEPAALQFALKSDRSDRNAVDVRITANWAIGADGIHSNVREYVAPHAPSRFTGQVAWRGVIPCEHLPESLLPEPYANLTMGPGKHVVAYYVDQGKAINYVAVIEQQGWQDESWTAQGSIPQLLGDFAGWNPSLLGLLEHSDPDQCFRWALHDRPTLPQWHRGRCLLIGDAVHPMLPFMAQGAAMAIEDAYILAELIADNGGVDTQVYQTFTHLRQQRTQRVQAQSARNGVIYHLRPAPLRWGRDGYLRLRSRYSPQFFNQNLRWLYDYRYEG